MKIKTLFDGTEINEKEFYKWLDALNSGEYKQAKGALQVFDGYCCLGVACKVLIPRELQRTDVSGNILGGNLWTQPNSSEWLRKINEDFKIKEKVYLTELNDSLDLSFERIASILYRVYVDGKSTQRSVNKDLLPLVYFIAILIMTAFIGYYAPIDF